MSDAQRAHKWWPGRGPELDTAEFEAIRPAVEGLLARLRGLAEALPADAEPPVTGANRPRR